MSARKRASGEATERAIGADSVPELDAGEMRRRGLADLDLQGDPEDLTRLVDALADPDWRVRRAAASLLADDENDLAIELMERLASEDAGERNAAVKTLIKRGAASLPVLLAGLRAEDLDVRNLSAVALGQLGLPEAVPGLLEALTGEKDLNVAYMIVEALGRIGDDRAGAALEGRLGKEPWTTAAAAEALGRIGSPESTTALARLLDDPVVAGVAAEALASLPDPRAVSVLAERAARSDAAEAPTFVRALMRALTRVEADAPEAAEILSRAGALPYASALEPALRAALESGEDARSASIAVLAWVPGMLSGALLEALTEPDRAAAARRALQRRASSDGEAALQVAHRAAADARAGVLSAIGASGERALAAALLPFLTDEDLVVRREAAVAIGTLGSPQHARDLLPLLEDLVADVADSAAAAIARLGPGPVSAELGVLARDRRPRVRRVAASAIAASRDPWADEELAAILDVAARDPEPAVRLQAAVGARSDGSGRALEALESLARDEDANVRRLAAGALVHEKDPRATTVLRSLLLDPVDRVCAAALPVLLLEERPIDAVVDSLRDAGPMTSVTAVRLLGDIGGTPAARVLETLLDVDDADLRSEVLVALAAADPAVAAVHAVTMLFDDTSWRVRAAAATALGGRRARDAITALRRALEDKEPSVRDAAAEALGRCGTEGIPTLLALVTGAHTTDTVAEALSRSGDDALGAIAHRARELTGAPAAEAVRIIGVVGGPEAARELLALITERPPLAGVAALALLRGGAGTYASAARRIAAGQTDPLVSAALRLAAHTADAGRLGR